MAHHVSATATLIALLLCSACSGDDASSARAKASATPSTSAEPAFTVAPAPTLDPTAALTQAFSTKVFRPAFSARLPANWVVSERHVDVFQTYLGDEDVEITLDHGYPKHESVAQGIARLSATDGLTVGPGRTVTVGGRRGTAVVAQFEQGVEFTDSGFHLGGSGPITIVVLPVPDGTTLTLFLTTRTDRAQALRPLRSLTDRVFATWRWT